MPEYPEGAGCQSTMHCYSINRCVDQYYYYVSVVVYFVNTILLQKITVSLMKISYVRLGFQI